MDDVGLNDRAIDPELAPTGELVLARQGHDMLVYLTYGLFAYQVRPSDERGIVRHPLQVNPAELPEHQGVRDQPLGLLVTQIIEPSDDEHPEDNLHRRGAATEGGGVGMAPG